MNPASVRHLRMPLQAVSRKLQAVVPIRFALGTVSLRSSRFAQLRLDVRKGRELIVWLEPLLLPAYS
jgi:hypothetical protein